MSCTQGMFKISKCVKDMGARFLIVQGTNMERGDNLDKPYVVGITCEFILLYGYRYSYG